MVEVLGKSEALELGRADVLKLGLVSVLMSVLELGKVEVD